MLTMHSFRALGSSARVKDCSVNGNIKRRVANNAAEPEGEAPAEPYSSLDARLGRSRASAFHWRYPHQTLQSASTMFRHVPNVLTGARLLLAFIFFAMLSAYQYQLRGDPTLMISA